MSGFEASPPSPPPSSVAVDFSSFGLPFPDGQQGLYLFTEGPFSPKTDSQGVPKSSDDASSPLSPLVASGFQRHRNYGHAGDAMLSAIDYSEHDILQEGGFDVPFGHLDGLLRLPHQQGGHPSDPNFDLLGDAELQLSPHTFSTVDTGSALGSMSDGPSEIERSVPASSSCTTAATTTTILQDESSKEAEEKVHAVQVALQQLGPRPTIKPGPTPGNGRSPSTQPCPVCGKVFANSSALTKHKLTHSDERKYVCHLCNKAFKRQDHLNGHMLTHRNKKPYQCDVEGCDKSYCDARSLRRHKENHHASVALTLLPFQLQLVAFPAAKDRHSGATTQWTTHQAPLLLAPKAPVLPSVVQSKESQQQSQANVKIEVQESETVQGVSMQAPKDAAPLLQRLLGSSAADIKKTWSAQVSYVETAPVNHVTTTPASDAKLSEPQTNVVEQKLVECSLCQRKFKNTPALNGHMRLHGGYFKKEPTDGGERSSSETPLQTASVGVRALLEEVVNQRRAAMREPSPPEDAVFTDEPLPSLSEWARPFRVPKAPAPRRHSDSDHLAYDDSGLLADLLMRQRRTSRINSDPGYEPLPAFAELQDLGGGGSMSEGRGQRRRGFSDSTQNKQGDDHTDLSLFDGTQETDLFGLTDPFHEDTEHAETRRAEELSEMFRKDRDQDSSTMTYRSTSASSLHSGGHPELAESLTSALPTTCPTDFMEPSEPARDVDNVNHADAAVAPRDSVCNYAPQTTLSPHQRLLVPHCSPTSSSDVQVTQVTLAPQASVPEFVPPSVSRHSPVLIHCHSSGSHPGAMPSVVPYGCLADMMSSVTTSVQSSVQTSVPTSVVMSSKPSVLVNCQNHEPVRDFVAASLRAAQPVQHALPLVTSASSVAAPPQAVDLAVSADSAHVQRASSAFDYGQRSNVVPSPEDSDTAQSREHACSSLKRALEDVVVSSPPVAPKIAAQELDDDVFLSPIPSSPLRARRKHRPEPLYIPPHVNAIGFPSRLRSPRLWDPAADNTGPKNGVSPPPYTPPPMLSPVRSGSGLFWHILPGGPRSAGLAPTTPQTVPSTPRAEVITEALSEEEEEPVPETDILPHVNIGPQFQARLPPVDVAKAVQSEHKADMVWNPEMCDQLLEEEVDAYLEFACCSAVAGGGRNKEYAMHVLALCQGNIQDATLWLMDRCPRLPPKHPLLSYRYPECHRWSREEIELYQEALNTFDKDFFSVAAKVGSKNVKQCVEFYYVWKKVAPDEYRRLRCLRRRREQDGLLQSQEDATTAVPLGTSPPRTTQEPFSTAPLPVQIVEQPPPLEFPCKLCGRVFAKVKSRNAHMKSHGAPKIASKFEF
ncbi:uncharacterized protein LOC135401406 isoform X2 [Ornithodoros turicata]|uniref:uncharacterized protein LOC135401406 isoform X2 n=1 Tax=Ornithodoros turicata TaxID=34597 RepID=UPI0031394C0B